MYLFSHFCISQFILVRLTLKIVVQNDRDFMEVIIIHLLQLYTLYVTYMVLVTGTTRATEQEFTYGSFKATN